MNFAAHPINHGFDAVRKTDLYRQMVRIRVFEQTALKRFSQGDMTGWLNLGIGQESIAAAVRSVMGPEDHSISGNRGLGHAIAAGMEMGPCLAELMGRTNGCSQGKAGMFGFYQPSRHHWGCHGLAAAQTPLAAGLAFAIKQRGTRGAVVCFMGDGAANQGVFHESLNLAGLIGLPVVYVIENNGFGMFTSVARSSRFTECLARRADTYGIEWDNFQDANPYEIRAKAGTAIERARLESRPSVLEIATYRFFGATIADSNNKRYRSPEEIAERKANHDPLKLWQQRLIEESVLDSSSVERIREQAIAEAQDATRFATQGTAPRIPQISEHVYWETDHDTPSARIGRHFFDE